MAKDLNNQTVKGIDLTKQNKWRARIGIGKNEIHLGNFNTKEEAILARKRAELEYSYLKKQYNSYETKNDFSIIYTAKNEPILIDTEDLEKCKKYTWHLNKYGYAVAYNKSHENDSICVYLHNIILDLKPNNIVIPDHIDRNPINNRKINLRIVNKSQNGMNSKIPKSNKTGYKGVHYDKRSKKFVATIKINYKQVYLGAYINIFDAVNARHNAEIKYFGEYMPTPEEKLINAVVDGQIQREEALEDEIGEDEIPF